jgi:hypothetical protein
MSVDRNNGDDPSSPEDFVSKNLEPAPGGGGSPPLNAGRKPVSARKLAANRANAARSTGPRTPEGKARVAMNALRHGLAAHAPLLPDEDPNALDALAEAYRNDLRPRGALEEELVARIVGIAWRLRRVARAEEAMWEDDDEYRVQDAKVNKAMRIVHNIPDLPWQTNIVPEPQSAARFVAAQFYSDGNSALERLAMYEQRLSRGLHAAIRELNALRKLGGDERGGEEVHDNRDDGARLGARSIAKTQAAVGAATGDEVASAQNKPTEPCASQETDSLEVEAAAQLPSDGGIEPGDGAARHAVHNKANEADKGASEPTGNEKRDARKGGGEESS